MDTKHRDRYDSNSLDEKKDILNELKPDNEEEVNFQPTQSRQPSHLAFFNYEQNIEPLLKLNVNIDELKKERAKLLRKIQATFKIKNKAPSTS